MRRRLRSLDFEEVRVETSTEGRFDLVIVFTDHSRPGCRFGFRWADILHWATMVDEPGPLANICFANLEEIVEAGDSDYPGLPCVPGEITWI